MAKGPDARLDPVRLRAPSGCGVLPGARPLGQHPPALLPHCRRLVRSSSRRRSTPGAGGSASVGEQGLYPLVLTLFDVLGVTPPGVAVACGPQGCPGWTRRAAWPRRKSCMEHHMSVTKVGTSRPWSSLPRGRGAALNPTSYRCVSKACTAGVHGPVGRRMVSPTRTTPSLTLPPDEVGALGIPADEIPLATIPKAHTASAMTFPSGWRAGLEQPPCLAHSWQRRAARQAAGAAITAPTHPPQHEKMT